MVEARSSRTVTASMLRAHPVIAALDAADRIMIHESPWMPLDPHTAGHYEPGDVATLANLHTRAGCDNVLGTYTLQADGRIGACCGLGLRTIPELNTATAAGEHFLEDALVEAESDFLKLWIRYFGPERILAWAAEKDPTVAWEGMYGHTCQACARLYKDPLIAAVIREHHAEMVAIVLQSAWLDDHYTPAMLT
jgi:hypothetical protein